MCIGRAPRMPDPPPPPPAPIAAPTRDDPQVVNEQRSARRRAISARGRSSTLLTGGQGLDDDEANVGRLTLLGG